MKGELVFVVSYRTVTDFYKETKYGIEHWQIPVFATNRNVIRWCLKQAAFNNGIPCACFHRYNATFLPTTEYPKWTQDIVKTL